MNFDNCICNLVKPCEVSSYAQYGVQANPPSNSNLPMFVIFQEGEDITLTNTTEILLTSGYLYLIDFIFLATPEADSYMQIIPEINGTPNLLYSFFAPTGSASRNTSASGSFTLPVTEDNVLLSFNLTYPAAVRNIDISGAISVTALGRLKKDNCILS